VKVVPQGIITGGYEYRQKVSGQIVALPKKEGENRIK
jgi:hypothetical protein